MYFRGFCRRAPAESEFLTMKRTRTNKMNHEDCARFSKIVRNLAAKIIAAQATSKDFDIMTACKKIMIGKKFYVSYRNDYRYLANAAETVADNVNEWGWG